MTWFEMRVKKHARLHRHFAPGLQALGANSCAVECANPRHLAGSVDFDQALAPSHPNDARWDYVIGFRTSRIIWLELHPAANGRSIDEVLRKASWTKTWVSVNIPDLVGEFVWVATGTIAYPPQSKHRKRVAEAGVRFAGSRCPLDKI